MSTVVIDGHPNPDSLTAAMARKYVSSHGDAELLAVRDLAFDPILHHGYQQIQELEPDLVRAQNAIERADNVVVATPIWWGSTPALLKGFFDRAVLPGWAFKYRDNSPLPQKLLKGKRGRLLVLTDSPRPWLWLTGDVAVGQVRRDTLGLVGISPVKVTKFSAVKTSSPEQRQAWLSRVADMARKDRAAS